MNLISFMSYYLFIADLLGDLGRTRASTDLKVVWCTLLLDARGVNFGANQLGGEQVVDPALEKSQSIINAKPVSHDSSPEGESVAELAS